MAPRYRPRHDRDAHVAAIRALITHILAFDAPSPEVTRYQRKAIDRLLWKLTEVDGKYTTRFRSEGAFDLERREDRRVHPAGQRLLQHEHVYTRSSLTRQLLARPAEATAILDLAIGCVVTRAEHERLKEVGAAEGWARYRAAGVRVYDLACDPPVLVAESHDLAGSPSAVPLPPPSPPASAAAAQAVTVDEDDEPESGQTRALSIKAAYAFGAEHGLAREMEQIRSMEIRWDSTYTTSVRRGYVVELFEKKGVFEEFKAKCWAHGKTAAGASKVRRCLRIKAEFEASSAAGNS